MSVLQSLSYIVRKVDAAISLGKRPPDHTSLSQTNARTCPRVFLPSSLRNLRHVLCMRASLKLRQKRKLSPWNHSRFHGLFFRLFAPHHIHNEAGKENQANGDISIQNIRHDQVVRTAVIGLPSGVLRSNNLPGNNRDEANDVHSIDNKIETHNSLLSFCKIFLFLNGV